MFIRTYFEEKEKKSKAMAAVAVIGAVVATAAAGAVIYKAFKSKVTPERPRVLGRIDMNGDGQLDATMLDTTGDGEVDTIVIDEE